MCNLRNLRIVLPKDFDICIIQEQEDGSDNNYSDQDADDHESHGNDSLTAKRASRSFVTNAVAAVPTVFLLAHTD